MDPIIETPRLKLALLTTVEKGSAEFASLYSLFSDAKATFWSLNGRAESDEYVEKAKLRILPTIDGEPKTYRVVYAVYRFLESSMNTAANLDQSVMQEDHPSEFIGLVNLKSMEPNSLPLPEDSGLPPMFSPTTLTIEIAYSFLPAAWGKGYAGEAANAMFSACQRARSFWDPYSKVYVRAIVSVENPRSLRVMDKIGMSKLYIYHWIGQPGERIFVGGRWREEDYISIHGKYLLE